MPWQMVNAANSFENKGSLLTVEVCIDILYGMAQLSKNKGAAFFNLTVGAGMTCLSFALQ